MQKVFAPKEPKNLWGKPLPKDLSVLEADIRKYRALLGSRKGLVLAKTHEHIGDLLSQFGKLTKDPAYFEECDKAYQAASHQVSIFAGPSIQPRSLRKIQKKRDSSLLERDKITKNFEPDDRLAPKPKEKERGEASRAARAEPADELQSEWVEGGVPGPKNQVVPTNSRGVTFAELRQFGRISSAQDDFDEWTEDLPIGLPPEGDRSVPASVVQFEKTAESSQVQRNQLPDRKGKRRAIDSQVYDDQKNWENFFRSKTVDSLVLSSPNEVDGFKNFPLESSGLGRFKTLKISGDLRNIPDLAERVRKFRNLKSLDLSNTTIDQLNVDEFRRSLIVDLTGSVIPLPLQTRLKKQLGDKNVTIESWPDQVEAYCNGSLLEWSRSKDKTQSEDRRQTRKDIRAFLNGESGTPFSLNNRGLRELPPDFHAMVAGREPTSIHLNGNKFGIDANRQAKPFDVSGFALMENLTVLSLANNGITAVTGLGALKQHDDHLKEINLKWNPLQDIPDDLFSFEKCKVYIDTANLSPLGKMELEIADCLYPENTVVHNGASSSMRNARLMLSNAEHYSNEVEDRLWVISDKDDIAGKSMKQHLSSQTQMQAIGDRQEAVDALFDQWSDPSESQNPQLPAAARYRRNSKATASTLFYGAIVLRPVGGGAFRCGKYYGLERGK